MPAQYTADAILAAIRSRANLPEADEAWSDSRLLDRLNEELQSWAVPFLMLERAEFLVTYSDTATVRDQTAYAVPSNALGGVLRSIHALDDGGNVWPMQQVDIKEVGPAFAVAGGVPSAFYMEGDNVVLVNTPKSDAWTLRMRYARTPSQVVLVSACAQITAIAGNVVTCSGGFPATFTNGAAMDFIHGGASFLPYSGSFSMPAPSGNNATFASVPSGLAVGDWLCLDGQAPFPQIPAAMIPALTQRVVAVVLEAQGDDRADREWRLFKDKVETMRSVLSPRVQANPKGLRGMLTRRFRPGGW